MEGGHFYQRVAVNAAAFLMIFVAVAFLAPVLSDGDTWWHLGAGRWIVEHMEVPSRDPFSFSQSGAPWHAHEWGAEVLMWLVYRAGGLAALIGLIAAAAGLAAAILCNFMQRHVSAVVALTISVVASLSLLPSAWARPHLLALPLLVFWAGTLFARSDDRPPRLPLALIMIVWANLHGSFLLGLMLIGPVAIEAVIKSKNRIKSFYSWIVFSVASFAFALITPFGFNGLLFPFQVSTMETLHYIGEWNPLSVRNAPTSVIIIITTLALFLTLGVRLTWFRSITYFGLLYMAFVHVRHQFVFAYVGWLIVGGALGKAVESSRLVKWKVFQPSPVSGGHADRWAMLGLLVICFIAAGIRFALPVSIEQRHSLPTALIQRIPPSLHDAPVFNEYSMGGPLIFSGIKPFIDGRADMYGDAFVDAYMRAERGDEATWQAIEQQYQIAWTILPPTSKLIPLLERAGWQQVIADDRAVVHARIPQSVQ